MSQTIIDFKGSTLDSSLEHELFSEGEFGFKVEAKFTNGNKEVFNNCTEVHWLYESNIHSLKRVAFESKIHGTGATYNIQNFVSIKIIDADKLEEDF